MNDDIGDAGVSCKVVGDGRFRHTIQRPWRHKFQGNVDPGVVMRALRWSATKFTILESVSHGKAHINAILVDAENGKHLDIDVYTGEVYVYPTSNDHADSSRKLLAILKEIEEPCKA